MTARKFALVLAFLLLLGCGAWAAAALSFDGPPHPWNVLLSCLYLLASAGVLWRVRRSWLKIAGGLALFAGVLSWWLTLRPSNERNWSPEYAQPPWAQIDGDRVVIHNFRNFDYRTEADFTPRWEEKTVHLSKIRGADFFMDYWGSPHIAHTLLSFDFGDEGHVCSSIETRREKGETYSAVRGFFRQFELYYVLGDERDLIRLRTNCRKEDVYLYPMVQMTPERSRILFLAYLRAANDLRLRPRWYNAATSNCTTNIESNVEACGVSGIWDWRILVNGHLDELLYQRGTIPSDLPFAQAKSRSLINRQALATGDGPDFAGQIRHPLPQTLSPTTLVFPGTPR